MKIKNISKFLVTATMLGTMFTANAESAENTNTSSLFDLIKVKASDVKSIKARNVEGVGINIVPMSSLTSEQKVYIHYQIGSNISINGDFNGQETCLVLVQPGNGKKYTNLYNRAGDFALVNTNISQYFVKAHEMAHCLNHNSVESVSQLIDLARDPRFEGRLAVLEALESSVRESHADLMAIMLGASKTGDWSVYTEAYLPLRTNEFMPTHSTTTAVSNIINEIDPKELKGKSFEFIAAYSNELFRKNFMTEQGQVDLQSAGVQNILKDWRARALETEMYLTYMGEDNTPEQNETLHMIQNLRETADLISKADPLHEHSDRLFAYSLKAAALEAQIKMLWEDKSIDHTTMIDLKEKSENALANLGFILSVAGENNAGSEKELKETTKRIMEWRKHYTREDASMILGAALSTLDNEAIEENTVSLESHALISEAEQQAKESIQLGSLQANDYVAAGITAQASKPQLRPTDNSRLSAGLGF